MPRSFPLSEGEFLEIESALRASEKGRAFLVLAAERSQAVSIMAMRQLLKQEFEEHRTAISDGTEQAHITILRQELQEMSSTIMQTRNEIAALRPNEAGNNRIMAATGELDAIVSATERATSSILNSAERLQTAVDKLPENEGTHEVREEIQNEVNEILMACSFQDITGQRTTKVVNTLRYLEQRVNAMIEIWGIESMDGAKPPLHAAPPDDQRPDSHLLNGPALEGGVSQDDVDALLAGLEPALADSDPKTANANDKPPRKEAAAKSPAPPPKPPAPAPAQMSESASQDEIDALFA